MGEVLQELFEMYVYLLYGTLAVDFFLVKET